MQAGCLSTGYTYISSFPSNAHLPNCWRDRQGIRFQTSSNVWAERCGPWNTVKKRESARWRTGITMEERMEGVARGDSTDTEQIEGVKILSGREVSQKGESFTYIQARILRF